MADYYSYKFTGKMEEWGAGLYDYTKVVISEHGDGSRPVFTLAEGATVADVENPTITLERVGTDGVTLTSD